MFGFVKTTSFYEFIKYKIAVLTYVLYSLGSWLMKASSMSCDLPADKYEQSSMCYSILFEQ